MYNNFQRVKASVIENTIFYIVSKAHTHIGVFESYCLLDAHMAVIVLCTL